MKERYEHHWETKLDDSFPTGQFLINTPFRLGRIQFGGSLLLYVRNCLPPKTLTEYK